MHNNIYKYIVKVFKMIHLDFQYAMLIRHTGILDGTIERGYDTTAIDPFQKDGNKNLSTDSNHDRGECIR